MSLVDDLRAAGAVAPLDHRFAQLLARRAGVTDDAVLAAAALAGSVGDHGHVCLSLPDARAVLTREAAARAVDRDADPALPALPDPAAWRTALEGATDIVRQPGDTRSSPLVLAGDALYLDRTWVHQQSLVSAIHARLTQPPPAVDPAAKDEILDRLFDPSEPRVALQRLAAHRALTGRLTVIAGGPGTGKTAVVVRLLAAFSHLFGAATVLLVAPTGKAAARMTESIRDRLEAWIPEELRGGVAPEASTIHRALKISPKTGRPRFDADRPVDADLVVVDEASMVDLPLMARLFAAVPPQAHLVLLGDPNQLVSVEKGAVLKELTTTPATAAVVVTLTESWRFAAGIARMATAINDGDAAEALAALDEEPELTLVELPDGDRWRALTAALREPVVRGYRPTLEASDPTAALTALRRFRVLCAHRQGPWGVHGLGPLIEGWLRADGLIPRTDTPWYPGQAVLIGRNDHQRRLYNGDVGVLRPDPAAPEGPLLAWFESTSGPPRAFAPAGLPPHETVFATTVHKAQGSEYEHVLVVLPKDSSPLLTRELLYTAVTRASHGVTVVGSAERIREAVATRTQRMSALGAALTAALTP